MTRDSASSESAANAKGHWALRLGELLAERRADDEPVIDLGIGQPDGEPPAAVARILASPPADHHTYPSSLGSRSLREAVAEWVGLRFAIDFAADDVAVTHGSKLAVALSTVAFAGAGGTVVAPDPGYPTYAQSAERIGASVRWLSLSAPDFVPKRDDLDAAFAGADLAFVNYPNNPTGAVATPEVFDDLIEAATEHGTILVHDAAYADLAHEGRGLSMFSRPGADAVAVEIHSFSKAFHLAGYRVAFALARGPILARLRRVLASFDTGASRMAQYLAEAVLREHPNFAEERRSRDARRTRIMAEGLTKLGCELTVPSASFYLWFRPPVGAAGWERIVRETGIACAPGEAFGPAGAGWIRLSCVQPDPVYDVALRRLEGLLLA